jgi:hypothetical protein
LLSNARRAIAGERITFNGRSVTPIYTCGAATMIERLQITSDEMRHMTRLIDRDEKRRRDRVATMAARRSAGMLSREDWLAGIRENP